MNIELLAAGWKAPSLIDVHGYPSFTLWLCGCNLRCPFCHNWRLAIRDQSVCKLVKVNDVLEALHYSARLVDYLHITGGEPLLQWWRIKPLLEAAHERRLRNSINTNCTLLKPLKELLEEELVDHIATDLKTPFTLMSGLPGSVASRLWSLFLSCLELTSSYGVEVELRIPVAKNIPGFDEHVRVGLEEASRRLSNTRWYIIVNPLRGPPHTNPRDSKWCRSHCDPGPSIVNRIVEIAREYNNRVYISVTTSSP